MLKLSKNFAVLGLAIVLLLSGCGLVSVTILLDKDIPPTSVPTEFYSYAVDVTDEDDWKDNVDNIESVNYVTFDLHLYNPGSTPVTFNGYVDDVDNADCTTSICAEGKIRVLKDITVAGDTHLHITAAQSLTHMEHMDDLKTLTKTGQFHFYGVSTGGTIEIESGNVVVAIVVTAF